MKEISKEGIDNRSIYKRSTAKITVIQGDFNCILHLTTDHKNRQNEER